MVPLPTLLDPALPNREAVALHRRGTNGKSDQLAVISPPWTPHQKMGSRAEYCRKDYIVLYNLSDNLESLLVEKSVVQ